MSHQVSIFLCKSITGMLFASTNQCTISLRHNLGTDLIEKMMYLKRNSFDTTMFTI